MGDTRGLDQELIRLPDDVRGWDRLKRPVWVFDPASRRGLYANPAALELWGAETQDELLARDFSSLSQTVITRLDRLAAATAGGGQLTERWTFYPNGQPVTVKATISTLVLTDGGTALLFEAHPTDVAEEERRAVEALRHTSSPTTLFDAGGRALFANPAAFAAYGAEAVPFIARFEDLAEGETVFRRVLAGEAVSTLAQVTTLAGPRAHHMDARQVTDPVTGAVSLLLSERDVTAQVEAERALAAAQERVEVATAKQRFLANMSHELRTPLNSVLGFAQVLGFAGLTETQSGHVEHIRRSGEGLLAIINDLIALAEIDAGDVILAEDPFELESLICGAVAAARPAADEKGLALTHALDPNAPEWLIGDAARLKKVIGHFLANAVKFTPQGAVTLAAQALPGQDAATALLEITVTDTGPGIAPELAPRLFQRFSLADDSARKAHGGSGLGLAISRELAALMGGEVGVESPEAGGARFWLRVPLPVDGAADTPTEAFEARPLTVLYADDHEANRLLVQTLLATQGHVCDLAEDGAQALEAARGGAYDLILMDIQMPVMDGVRAAREIRALPGKAGATPILALTANTLDEQLEAYAAAGMNDCIPKPVDMLELITKVAAWSRAA